MGLKRAYQERLRISAAKFCCSHFKLSTQCRCIVHLLDGRWTCDIQSFINGVVLCIESLVAFFVVLDGVGSGQQTLRPEAFPGVQ